MKFARTPLEKILLDGIRKHAQDGNSPLRFWARFIIELGRQRNEPSDMLTADPKNVRLDAIQAMLILRRLAGDFYGFAQREQQASALLQAQPVQRAPARRAAAPRLNPLFIRAALHEGASPRLVRAIEAEAAHAAQRGGPCAPLGEGDAANILDAGAVIITTGWEKLLDFLRAESLLAERSSQPDWTRASSRTGRWRAWKSTGISSKVATSFFIAEQGGSSASRTKARAYRTPALTPAFPAKGELPSTRFQGLKRTETGWRASAAQFHFMTEPTRLPATSTVR